MAATLTPTSVEPVQVPMWTFAVLFVAAFGSYIMLQENGFFLTNWMTVHEFFHDARHALGLPCH